MLKRVITAVAVGAVALALLFVAWQWYRFDTAIAFFRVARDYLHNDMGLPLPVVIVVTAAGAVGLFAVLGTFLFRPAMAVAAMLALLLVALPLSYWLSEVVAPRSCFDRQTGAALCVRWQAPEGCRIVRKDGARPQGPWRRLREATEEDVAYCAGSPADEQRPVLTPRPMLPDSCTGQAFFDPTGTPIVYWSLDDKTIELWDRQGRHPVTGVPLKSMTTEVARKYCEQLATARREREQAAERERQAEQAAETLRLQLEAKAAQVPRNEDVAGQPPGASAAAGYGQAPAPQPVGASRPPDVEPPREVPVAPTRPIESPTRRDPFAGIAVR